MTSYETVIGLEVHVELQTRSKLFCACANRYGAEPNTLCCETCLGLPGALPVLNRHALELALRAALALNCSIPPVMTFDRKHYFYPDLPKGYQITQHIHPIGRDGFLEIPTETGSKRIGIAQLHMEEDAGRLTHSYADEGVSLVDYNRSGVPLIEIVTAPDLSSPQEARLFLETLKNILEYIEVSDCKMQEGSLRCDANLSIRPYGSSDLGTKTELKNVNSFRNIELGLEFEHQRQVGILAEGGEVVAETRRWDDDHRTTQVLRTKEEGQGYRYMHEPDLPAVILEHGWVEAIRQSLPELPEARRQRLVRDHQLTAYEASMITRSRALADRYEQMVGHGVAPKTAVSWLLGELSRLRSLHRLEWEQMPVSAKELATLLERVTDGKLSTATAKECLATSFATGRSLNSLLCHGEMEQISDEEALRQLVAQTIATYPHVVAEIHAGKERAFMYLVGQVMKASRGRANPGVVHKLLNEELNHVGKDMS